MNRPHRKLSNTQVAARPNRLIKAIGLGLLLNAIAVCAQPVHVQVERSGGTEYGAGNSVGKGSECYVVTPAHVIEGAGKNAITVTSLKGKRAKARVIKQTLDFDAALLKLDSKPGFDCPEDWDDGRGLSQRLDKEPFLISKKVNGNGRIEQNRLFLSGVSAEFIDMEPFDARSKLQEGDSGSSVYAGNRLVGMVITVDTGTGTVQAVSQSQLHGLFGNDVLVHTSQHAMLVPFTYNWSENVYATSAAHDYLAERTPLALQDAAPLTRQQMQTGELPEAPKDVDFVITGKILEVTSKRINNPDYKPPQNNTKKKEKKSFKDQLLASFKKTFTKTDENARFLTTFNIDVEIQVLETSSSKHNRNLERIAYEVPDDGSNVKELQKTMIRKAVIDSLAKTFKKYDLPVK